MSFLDEVKDSIIKVTSNDSRPVVIFSSIWPLMNEAKRKDRKFVNELLDVILETFKGRTILMPTFTSGFRDGVCNLDNEKSSTGALSETFRTYKGVQRTKSAYFPFSFLEDKSGDLERLIPKHSWGEGSVYEWMEVNDVDFLMLGSDATHCSYLHRLELLAKDYINYRYDKTFKGKLILNGEEFDHEETLYVRSLDPVMENDFRALEPILKSNGMKESDIRGIRITGYTAKEVKNSVLPIMISDPLFTVKNKQDFMEK